MYALQAWKSVWQVGRVYDGGSSAVRIVPPCLFCCPQLLLFYHRKTGCDHPLHTSNLIPVLLVFSCT